MSNPTLSKYVLFTKAISLHGLHFDWCIATYFCLLHGHHPGLNMFLNLFYCLISSDVPAMQTVKKGAVLKS